MLKRLSFAQSKHWPLFPSFPAAASSTALVWQSNQDTLPSQRGARNPSTIQEAVGEKHYLKYCFYIWNHNCTHMQKNETQRMKPVLVPRFLFSILKYYIKTPFKSCLSHGTWQRSELFTHYPNPQEDTTVTCLNHTIPKQVPGHLSLNFSKQFHLVEAKIWFLPFLLSKATG